MNQHYYSTLTSILFLSSSLIAMEKESANPGYSIGLNNSAIVVKALERTNHEKVPVTSNKIKKIRTKKSTASNASQTNSVASSPNNIHRVFQQN